MLKRWQINGLEKVVSGSNVDDREEQLFHDAIWSYELSRWFSTGNPLTVKAYRNCMRKFDSVDLIGIHNTLIERSDECKDRLDKALFAFGEYLSRVADYFKQELIIIKDSRKIEQRIV